MRVYLKLWCRHYSKLCPWIERGHSLLLIDCFHTYNVGTLLAQLFLAQTLKIFPSTNTWSVECVCVFLNTWADWPAQYYSACPAATLHPYKQSPRSSTSHPAQWEWSGPLLSSRRVCPYGSFSNRRAGFSGLQWTLKRQARGSVTPLIACLEDNGSANMAATTQQISSLPSGLRICTTVPDILYLPELVRERNIWCSEMTMVYSLIAKYQIIWDH